MTPQRARNGWRDRRDAYRAVLALACLACVIAFSALVQTNEPARERRAATSQALADDEIYTGSILFMPYEGNDCRQHLLDNLSGRIWDNGVVACDGALAHSAGLQARQWSAARVDAIRGGFAKR